MFSFKAVELTTKNERLRSKRTGNKSCNQNGLKNGRFIFSPSVLQHEGRQQVSLSLPGGALQEASAAPRAAAPRLPAGVDDFSGVGNAHTHTQWSSLGIVRGSQLSANGTHSHWSARRESPCI